jgi:hypothetical protein
MMRRCKVKIVVLHLTVGEKIRKSFYFSIRGPDYGRKRGRMCIFAFAFQQIPWLTGVYLQVS